MKHTTRRLQELINSAQTLLKLDEAGFSVEGDADRLVVALSDQLGTVREDVLYAARRAGKTWTELAELTGKSEQSVRNMYLAAELRWTRRNTPGAGKGAEAPVNVDEIPITQLFLGSRTNTTLRLKQIHTVGDLRKLTATQLLKLPNLGHVSLSTIEFALSQYGVGLARSEAS
jgi:DNA-directed RNA polymerase alpha subunit